MHLRPRAPPAGAASGRAPRDGPSSASLLRLGTSRHPLFSWGKRGFNSIRENSRRIASFLNSLAQLPVPSVSCPACGGCKQRTHRRTSGTGRGGEARVTLGEVSWVLGPASGQPPPAWIAALSSRGDLSLIRPKSFQTETRRFTLHALPASCQRGSWLYRAAQEKVKIANFFFLFFFVGRI